MRGPRLKVRKPARIAVSTSPASQPPSRLACYNMAFGDAYFREARDQGNNLRGAELGRLLDYPFKGIGSGQRQSQHEAKGSLRPGFYFLEVHNDDIAFLPGHLAAVADPLSVEDLYGVPCTESQHIAKVVDLVGWESGDPVLYSLGRNEESPPGHGR